MIRNTTIEEMLKCAITLNSLLIPIKSVESTLSYYTHPLVVFNHDTTYPFSPMGSSVGIYYRDRYLLLCTRHQLKILDDRSYEDIGLLDKDGSIFCSAAGIRHYPHGVNETDLNDLVVFDFTAPCKERPHMKERFLNLKFFPEDVPIQAIAAFIISGYPSEMQQYNFNEEERHWGLHLAPVVCELAPKNEQSADPTLLRLSSVSSTSFNPDGMSGGAAFVIQLINGRPHAYLAGIIVRAGRSSFSILRIEFIRKMIDSWICNH